MHRFRLVLLGLVLITLAAGLRSKVATVLPAKILGAGNRKLVTGAAPDSPKVRPLFSGRRTWRLVTSPNGAVPMSRADPTLVAVFFDSGTATASVDVVSPRPYRHPFGKTLYQYIEALRSLHQRWPVFFRWLEPENHVELYYKRLVLLPQDVYFPRRQSAVVERFSVEIDTCERKRSVSLPSNVGNRPDGAMYFYLYNQNSKTSYSQTIKDIPEGKWFRVEAFYKCAGDNTGQVTFWQGRCTNLRCAECPERAMRTGHCGWRREQLL